jgi:hypothetical protein
MTEARYHLASGFMMTDAAVPILTGELEREASATSIIKGENARDYGRTVLRANDEHLE